MEKTCWHPISTDPVPLTTQPVSQSPSSAQPPLLLLSLLPPDASVYVAAFVEQVSPPYKFTLNSKFASYMYVSIE